MIRVLNFFRANDTVHGHGIRTWPHAAGIHPEAPGHISERFIRGVFTRMLNGLREVHSNKLLHLDLKPSNIYLRSDNTPVLIDFGAARQTLLNDQPMLKPMYNAGLRLAGTLRITQGSRAVERHLQRRRVDVRLPGRVAPQAADSRLKKDT